MMGISRSGYYKWKKRGKSDRDIQRRELIALVDTVHAEHRSHGYRWTAAYIRQQYGYECSDNFVYKSFRYLGIKAETKHQVQLAYRIAARKGDRYQYINGLENVKELLKGHTEPVVLHTDQGSVYASKAYNDLIKDSVIVRSMSRSGKPTDNLVNESINGWMKEELFMDFKIEECRRREEFAEVLERYVDFYNNRRPCYAIGYDTPVNYRKRYYRGEIERKNTFEGRSLTEEPKFVAKRRKQAHAEGVSTLKKEK